MIIKLVLSQKIVKSVHFHFTYNVYLALLPICCETGVNINPRKYLRFSNRTVKHSSRTVIACDKENDNHLSVYPQEANMYVLDMVLHT